MHNTYHTIIDINDVSSDVCENDSYILEVLIESAKKINATVISTNRYRFGFESPAGCTAFVMLDESHISAHTYASNNKIAIDVFTCNGKDKCSIAAKYIISQFNSVNYTIETIERFR